MTIAWTRGIQTIGFAAIVLAATAGGACGGGGNGGANGGGGAGDGGDDGAPVLVGDGGDAAGFGNTPTITALSIKPLLASLTIQNGQKATQSFQLVAQYSDGTTGTITNGVSWASDLPAVGGVGANGLYTANGSLGGIVHVLGSYKGKSATATLTVKLQVLQNPINLPPSVQTSLQGATAPDGNVVWAYPYDGTVWGRGLLAPILQWNGGAATDDYYVHIVSATFELQEFTTAMNAPASRYALDPTAWQQFTDSTAGAANVTVARWDGANATVIAKQAWTVAPASMRGTIYYWSNNLGRVLRIKPGAAAPDDFANAAPLNDPAQYQQDSCLMTCHTVSADGSTLVSGGGTYAGSYDLGTGQPTFSLGGTWGFDPNTAGQPVWQNIQWEVPALSPDGKYILTDSMAQNGVSDYMGPSTVMGLFLTANGTPVATSGVQGKAFSAPAWSPEGSRVAFVESGDPSGWNAAGYNWQNPPPGDLKVIQFDATKNPMFSGEQSMVSVGSGNPITWPSVSPDGKWVIYSRAASFDTRNGPGDLYFASAVTPNQEVRLAKLDGDGYPFAAGSRDLSYNYEPSFAPVAAGGILLGRLHQPAHVREHPHGAGGSLPQSAERVHRGQAALDRRHRPEPQAGGRSEPRGVPPDGAGRDEPRDAGVLFTAAVREERAGLHVRNRLLRRILLGIRRRRRARVRVDAQRLLADGRQVHADERLLQRRLRRHVHQPRVLGADASVTTTMTIGRQGAAIV